MLSAKQRLYLASQSPRRAQLLRQIGVNFELISIDVDETLIDDEKEADYVERLARSKAAAGWNSLLLLQSEKILPVLGADTAVVIDGQIMGKPIDREHGAAMLRQLSATTHQVVTGICLRYRDLQHTAVIVTDVKFRKITEQEIFDYWESGEPQGKAGGYAIQGLGAIFVESINGSYSSVVGLPLAETYQLLEQIEQESQL